MAILQSDHNDNIAQSESFKSKIKIMVPIIQKMLK